MEEILIDDITSEVIMQKIGDLARTYGTGDADIPRDIKLQMLSILALANIGKQLEKIFHEMITDNG